MNTDLISSLKLMGMGMGAIFFVIIVVYFVIHLLLRFTRDRKENAGASGR